MGSSLSRQEELFITYQWPALLEEAMIEAAEDSALGLTPMGNDRRHFNSAGGARVDVSRKGFTLGFNEWQAFLAVLESGKEGKDDATDAENYATLSAICQQLRPGELHCPLVVLTVHAHAWWANGISNEDFMERMTSLLGHVLDLDQSFAVEDSEQQQSEIKETVAASKECPDNGHNEASKRGLLKKGLKRLSHTLSLRIKRSKRTREDNSNASQSPIASKAAQPSFLYVSEFQDLVSLFCGLLEKHANLDLGLEDCETVNSVLRAPTLRRQEKEEASLLQCLMDLKIDRPVIRVALSLSLAIYAIMYPLPTYASEGIQQLRLLESAMQMQREKQRRTASHRPSAHDSVEKITEHWPSVGRLESALLFRQYELDACECLSSTGVELAKSLAVQRRAHETADTNLSCENPNHALSSPSFKSMNLSERWEYCKSQYIGQRHIWDALKVHFLSANIFDVNKPTVLIFFGPSGYGKSELAKQIASAIHGVPVPDLETSGKLIFLHMPSFCTKDSIYSLVDPPAAHVGDGILLSALLQHPDAVVVLDEFEKSTAEAVQHIWLSAFQKNGVLRSLKRADRSVSTVRTTFILTCNIAAETIDARRALYVGLRPPDQATARAAFEALCKRFCQTVYGDPFVNRVDFAFPFVPYTEAERGGFVRLQLGRLLATQWGKGRGLHPTPRAVRAMVDRLKSFHGEAVEAGLRPALLWMAQRGHREAVLTVEERLAGPTPRFVVVPCHTSEDSTTGAREREREEERGEGGEGGAAAAAPGLAVAWEDLPGGPACLAMWRQAAASEEPEAVRDPSAPHSATSSISSLPPFYPAVGDGGEIASERGGLPLVVSAATGVCGGRAAFSHSLETVKEVVYDTNSQKLLDLQTELSTIKAVLLSTEKELQIYKQTAMLLEKLLGVVLLALCCCLGVLYIIIGIKLTLFLVLSFGFVAFGLLRLPLRLIFSAVRALFNTLGPYKSAVLLVCILLWGSRTLKDIRCVT